MTYTVDYSGACTKRACPSLPSCDPPDGMPFSFLLLDDDTRGVAKVRRDAELVQKLGQLQLFLAVFPQECMASLHLLGRLKPEIHRVEPESGSTLRL